jgi:hypothetical protein
VKKEKRRKGKRTGGEERGERRKGEETGRGRRVGWGREEKEEYEGEELLHFHFQDT